MKFCEQSSIRAGKMYMTKGTKPNMHWTKYKELSGRHNLQSEDFLYHT